MPNKQFQVPVNLVNLSSDPASGSEGDMYYNTISDVVKVYANGVWVGLATLSGATFTGNLSGNSLFNIGTQIASTLGPTITQTVVSGTSVTYTTSGFTSIGTGDIIKVTGITTSQGATTSATVTGYSSFSPYTITATPSEGVAVSGTYTGLTGTLQLYPKASIVGSGRYSVPLIVRGSSIQASNLQEWQNSSGTTQMNVTQNGALYTNGTIYSSFGSGSIYGGYISGSAGTFSTSLYGFVVSTPTLSLSGSSSGSATIKAQSVVSSGVGFTLPSTGGYLARTSLSSGVVGTTTGGTGLSYLGSAGQALIVDSSGTGYTFGNIDSTSITTLINLTSMGTSDNTITSLSNVVVPNLTVSGVLTASNVGTINAFDGGTP